MASVIIVSMFFLVLAIFVSSAIIVCLYRLQHRCNRCDCDPKIFTSPNAGDCDVESSDSVPQIRGSGADRWDVATFSSCPGFQWLLDVKWCWQLSYCRTLFESFQKCRSLFWKRCQLVDVSCGVEIFNGHFRYLNWSYCNFKSQMLGDIPLALA